MQGYPNKKIGRLINWSDWNRWKTWIANVIAYCLVAINYVVSYYKAYHLIIQNKVVEN